MGKTIKVAIRAILWWLVGHCPQKKLQYILQIQGIARYFNITHPGTLDLKAAMFQKGKPCVLSKQIGPILPPSDCRLWVPRCLTPE